MTEIKTTKQIEELSQDENFTVFVQDYVDNFKFCNELKEEIRTITPFPRVMQIAVDRLLKYHENLIRAELELEGRGLSKTDVFAWQYDSIENCQ